MKIKVYKNDFRRYTDKALEAYQEKGLNGLQEFCVCSQLNIVAMYSILLETIEDDTMVKKRDDLLKFYNYDVVE